MIKTHYPPAFESFWSELNKIKTRTLGSKPEAYKACQALKVEPEDYPYLLNQYKLQKLQKERLKAMGIFEADFQDICRWIRNRRFEDAPDERATEKALPRSDQRKRAAAERYLAKHMAGDMDAPGSNQTNLGGTGQLNLRVLENKS